MRYLVDTSVLGRAHQERVGDRLEELAKTGRLWTCGLIDLEVVYGSRARDVAEVIEERRALPEGQQAPSPPGRHLITPTRAGGRGPGR